MSDRIPQIFAHRGASAVAPENTLPAFERAVAMGADVVETDVHWTKDGVIVISHDGDVSRLSNGDGAIVDLTYNELKQLDFGYHFTQDEGRTYPFRNCGVSIVSLADLLQRFPQMRFNIDVKPEIPASLRTFITVLHECDALSRVIAASFHQPVLTQLRQMSPHLKTSASRREVTLALLNSWLPMHRRTPYVAAQIPHYAGRLLVASQHFVRSLHRRGAQVDVWTIDDETEMQQLLNIGVDGIVTNRPDTAVKIRNEFLLKSAAKDPKV